MTSKTVRLRSSDWVAYLTRLGSERYMEAALRGAKRAAMRGVSTLQRAAGRAPPANPGRVGAGGAVNTGFYKRAWKWGVLPDGSRIFNAAPYAAVIEHGRRPDTMPPRDALALWARRRLGLSATQARRAAFAIGRAIARRGLMARKVLTNASPEIERDFLTEVKAEMERELGRTP